MARDVTVGFLQLLTIKDHELKVSLIETTASNVTESVHEGGLITKGVSEPLPLEHDPIERIRRLILAHDLATEKELKLILCFIYLFIVTDIDNKLLKKLMKPC
nr:pyruvate dehydrogenase E1 component subunit alpha, mitochondrial [Tanacetum cinerariifolium]